MEKNSDGVGGWGEERKKMQLVRKEGGEDLDRRGVKCEGKRPQREMEGFYCVGDVESRKSPQSSLDHWGSRRSPICFSIPPPFWR